MTQNLYALLRSRFPPERDALFVTIPKGRSIPYSSIDQITARFAGALRNLGVTRGERLLISVDKSPEAILVYLAALRLGAIFVPLNPAYTAREFKYFLHDAQPRTVILRPNYDSEKQQISEEAGVKTTSLDAFNNGSFIESANATSPYYEIEAVDSNLPAAILYTSGTTGLSKGAILTHSNLISNGLTLHRIWGFKPGDVLLHALPVFHVHGLFVAIHCAMLNASKMLFLQKFEVNTVVKHLPKATVMMGVPTFYARLLEHPSFDESLCANMRLFISGSAPLLPQTWETFKQKTKHKILERYGMSEAGMIASNPLEGDRVPGTVGFGLPGTAVRISNHDGTRTGLGEIGVLETKGPNVFSGYWNRPDLTTTEFRPDGFFITGDMAKMSVNGRITIVGRSRDLVISGGLNVYPKEIEDCLNQLPDISESAVIGIPHADFGEALLAFIVCKSEARAGEQAIISALRMELAGFKIPRRIIRLDRLPKNIMGKVQKNILRENYLGTFEN